MNRNATARLSTLLAVAALGLGLAPRGAEAAPPFLPVQGFLTDGEGAPIDREAMLNLALYREATGGTAVYAEQQSVLIERGYFTLYLGQNTPLDLGLFRDNVALYLGISIDGDEEMRFPLASTGFAAFAQYAGEAGRVPWNAVQNVPPSIADGDDDTTYTATAGVALNGTTFSLDRRVAEAIARGAAYDTPAELRAELDGAYTMRGTTPVTIQNNKVALTPYISNQILK